MLINQEFKSIQYLVYIGTQFVQLALPHFLLKIVYAHFLEILQLC